MTVEFLNCVFCLTSDDLIPLQDENGKVKGFYECVRCHDRPGHEKTQLFAINLKAGNIPRRVLKAVPKRALLKGFRFMGR